MMTFLMKRMKYRESKVLNVIDNIRWEFPDGYFFS